MTVVRRPIFLLDVADCADYLFTEGGEDVAQRWKQSLDKGPTHNPSQRQSPDSLPILARFSQLGKGERVMPPRG
jgi:hypothetical protein